MGPELTPYDITSVPHIAYAPGYAEWASFLLVVFTFIAFKWLRQIFRTNRRNAALKNALSGLERIHADARDGFLGKADLEKGSLIIKRFLSIVGGIPLEHRSSGELAEFLKHANNPEVRTLCDHLIEFDTMKYRQEDTGLLPKAAIADCMLHLKLFAEAEAKK